MKNPLKTFFLFLLMAATGSCRESTQERLVQVKAGYFFFSDSKMREVYDRGGLDIQLCASYPLCHLTSRLTLNAYGAVEYLQRSGRSSSGHQKTSLWQIPVNFGLKASYGHTYFAMGPRYFHIYQHNHSQTVFRTKSGNGLGLFVNTGFNYIFCNRYIVDIFGEYSYAKSPFDNGRCCVYTRNIQVGGLTFGGGLGYAF